MSDTVRSALDRALAALDGLEELGQEVEDEWTYVSDLADAWRSRIEGVAGARGDEAIATDRAGAIDRIIDEAGLIVDPHRAIDWLSTMPQVVLLAIGEQR